MTAQYFFETVNRQTVHIFGGQQHLQHAWAGHAFFQSVERAVRSGRCHFTGKATVDLTNVLDHADWRRHDSKLLADLLADGMFAAAAGIAQFMPG